VSRVVGPNFTVRVCSEVSCVKGAHTHAIKIISKRYKMFQLKHSPNYSNICKLWWQYKFSFVKNLQNTSTADAENIQLKDKHPPKLYHQSVHCHIRHILVRIRISKCFTNSSKQFRWECCRTNTRSAREYTMFVRTQPLRNWREQRPSIEGHLQWSVTGKIGRVYYTVVAYL
jgi:hypothetical protein